MASVLLSPPVTTRQGWDDSPSQPRPAFTPELQTQTRDLMLTKNTFSLGSDFNSLFKVFDIYTDFLCGYMWAYKCHSRHAEIRGQPEDVGSILSPCGNWQSNSGRQVRQQMPTFTC